MRRAWESALASRLYGLTCCVFAFARATRPRRGPTGPRRRHGRCGAARRPGRSRAAAARRTARGTSADPVADRPSPSRRPMPSRMGNRCDADCHSTARRATARWRRLSTTASIASRTCRHPPRQARPAATEAVARGARAPRVRRCRLFHSQLVIASRRPPLQSYGKIGAKGFGTIERDCERMGWRRFCQSGWRGRTDDSTVRDARFNAGSRVYTGTSDIVCRWWSEETSRLRPVHGAGIR